MTENLRLSFPFTIEKISSAGNSKAYKKFKAIGTEQPQAPNMLLGDRFTFKMARKLMRCFGCVME